MTYRELEVTVGGTYRGIAIKISDDCVWVKFEDEDDLILCNMKDVEIVYKEMEEK